MQYSKKVTDLESELCTRLLGVCKKIYNLRNSYKDFLPEVSRDMKEKEKAKILDIFGSDVTLTLQDANKKYEGILKSISSKKKPHITAGDASGAVEFNSALMFVNSLPEAWQEILKVAFNDKRYDFVFSVLDLIRVNKKEPQYKIIVEKLERDYEKSLGIESEKNDLIMLKTIRKKSEELMSYDFDIDKTTWDNLKSEDVMIIKEFDGKLYEQLREEKYPLNRNENGKAGYATESYRGQFEERGITCGLPLKFGSWRIDEQSKCF